MSDGNGRRNARGGTATYLYCLVTADRRPSLVSIVAPAGTGKTRLLEEFLEGLPALAPDATVATAQCLPYGQRLTYWPLRTLLLRVLRLDEDASATGLREATRAWLAESGTPDAERIAELHGR